jgi:hypothetical protein
MSRAVEWEAEEVVVRSVLDPIRLKGCMVRECAEITIYYLEADSRVDLRANSVWQGEAVCEPLAFTYIEPLEHPTSEAIIADIRLNTVINKVGVVSREDLVGRVETTRRENLPLAWIEDDKPVR